MFFIYWVGIIIISLLFKKVIKGALSLHLLPMIRAIDIAVFDFLVIKYDVQMLLPFHHFIIIDHCKQIFDGSIDCIIMEGFII